MDSKLVGEILRRYRKGASLSQREVAQRCQMSQPTISALESGRFKDPPLFFVLRYLRAVGFSYSKFFSELEAEEFKGEIKPWMEREELPVKTKKKIRKYALGISYFKPPVISFPEYAKEKIRKELITIKAEESLADCLTFAQEYFSYLEKTQEEEGKEKQLREMKERYEAKGLKTPLILKVMQITRAVWKREVKRAICQRPVSPEEQKRQVARYSRQQAKLDRVNKEVNRFLFARKGVNFFRQQFYQKVAREFFGLLNKAQGEVSEEKVRDWREKKIKEGAEEEVLIKIMEIVADEWAKS